MKVQLLLMFSKNISGIFTVRKCFLKLSVVYILNLKRGEKNLSYYMHKQVTNSK